MRVLFIDFDGVLHATSGPAAAMREFVWLPILKEIIAGQDDLRVVIHASYRKATPEDFLRQRLGFSEEICLGVTNPKLERWASIQHWLGENSGVESFRILDDQVVDFPYPPPSELILCDGRKGLSDEGVQQALRGWVEPAWQRTLREWDQAPNVGLEIDAWR